MPVFLFWRVVCRHQRPKQKALFLRQARMFKLFMELSFFPLVVSQRRARWRKNIRVSSAHEKSWRPFLRKLRVYGTRLLANRLLLDRKGLPSLWCPEGAGDGLCPAHGPMGSLTNRARHQGGADASGHRGHLGCAASAIVALK